MEGFENFSDKYCFHRIRSTLLVLSNTVLVLHNLVLVLVLVLVLSAQCSVLVLVLVLSAQCSVQWYSYSKAACSGRVFVQHATYS
jgi:hypothetical protein